MRKHEANRVPMFACARDIITSCCTHASLVESIEETSFNDSPAPAVDFKMLFAHLLGS